MESNQLNKTSDEDVIAELLTLDCEVDSGGTKRYRNKEGELHRIHGPAISWPNGTKFWYKNGDLHREDGPAITWDDGREYYYINGIWLTKDEFIEWQKENSRNNNK